MNINEISQLSVEANSGHLAFEALPLSLTLDGQSTSG